MAHHASLLFMTYIHGRLLDQYCVNAVNAQLGLLTLNTEFVHFMNRKFDFVRSKVYDFLYNLTYC